MSGFTRSITIARPVEEVFAFATDLDNASRLLPGVTKVEMLGDGGMRPGARFRETRRMHGKEQSAVIEIVEHSPPSVHAASSSMLGMTVRYTFRFFPEGLGTRVDMEAVVTGNLLWKPFLGMIVRAVEKEDGEYLQRLKEAVEGKGGEQA